MLKMLRALSLLLFSLASLHAQDEYQPLVQEGAHWKICQSSTEEIWDCGWMYEYVLKGDTLIDNLLYKRLFQRFFQSNGMPGGGLSSYDTPFLVVGEELAGFMREDVSGRKVYFRATEGYVCGDTPAGEEVLLFDFALSVGDPIQGCLTEIFGGESPTVSAITVENWYGQDRKAYYLESIDVGSFVLIEGLGFSSGLLSEPFLNISGGYTELWDYCVGSDMDCNVSVPGMMVSPYQEWHLLHFGFNFVNGNSSRVTFEYQFTDTVQQNGHTYFQLERRQDVFVPDWTPTPYLFRQDGPLVYRDVLESPAESELLLYDFSLSNLGASLPPIDHWLLNDMELVAIDSVTLQNGVKRKRLRWEDPNSPYFEYSWVEGIGANDHPFTPEWAFADELDGEGIELLCFYQKPELDEPQYTGEIWNGDCLEFLVDVDEQSSTTRRLYPNPFTDFIQLEGAQTSDYLIWTSATGQAIGTFSPEELQRNAAGLSHLPVGLYYYQWFNARHELVQVGKVVKI